MTLDPIEVLKKRGLKATSQRLVVLEELTSRQDHPTADDLHRSLSPRYPTLALSTVYSTLESFVRAGLAERLSLGEEADRYDGNVNRHDHLVCTDCGRVEDVPHVAVPTPDLPHPGYTYISSRVVHYGLCPDCRARSRDGGPGKIL